MNAHASGLVGRRQFLSHMALGATASLTAAGLGNIGPLCSNQAWAAAPRWKMRLSGSTINFMQLPIEEACHRIATLGFDAIDIWSGHAGCPHLDDALTRLGPDGLKRLLTKHQLSLCSFSVYQGGYAKYAALLGKVGGGVAIRSSEGPCEPKDLTSQMKKFLEALKPEIELAEKYDSYLAIENHGHALLDSPDAFKAFVDNNTNRRVGIALAPYHLQRLEASVEETIEIAGKQLLYLYAWQHAPGTAQLPGVGPADFTPWLAALAKIDYAGYVNPFMHGEPAPDAMSKALAKSCDYLRKCHAKAVDA